MTLLSQAPAFDIWKVASEHGFYAVLVILLLFWIREIYADRRKEAEKWRKSQDWATRTVTIALIQLGANLIPGVKEQLVKIKQEMHDSEHEEEPKE